MTEPGRDASPFAAFLASRAASTVLRTVADQELCRNARERGRQLHRALDGDRPCSGPGGVGASPTSGGA